MLAPSGCVRAADRLHRSSGTGALLKPPPEEVCRTCRRCRSRQAKVVGLRLRRRFRPAPQAAILWPRSARKAVRILAAKSCTTLSVVCAARRSLFRSRAVGPLCPSASGGVGGLYFGGASIAAYSFLLRVLLPERYVSFRKNYIEANIRKNRQTAMGLSEKTRRQFLRELPSRLSGFGPVSRPGGSVHVPVLVLRAVG